MSRGSGMKIVTAALPRPMAAISTGRQVILLACLMAIFGCLSVVSGDARAIPASGFIAPVPRALAVADQARRELQREFQGLELAVLDYRASTGRAAVEGLWRHLISDATIMSPDRRIAIAATLSDAAMAFDAREPSAHVVTSEAGLPLACIIVPAAPGSASLFPAFGDLELWHVIDHETAHCLFALNRIASPRHLNWPSFQESGAEYYAMGRLYRRFPGTPGAIDRYARAARAVREDWFCRNETLPDQYARHAYRLAPAIERAIADGERLRRIGTADLFVLSIAAARDVAVAKHPSIVSVRCAG
jgi:hypothetical protein